MRKTAQKKPAAGTRTASRKTPEPESRAPEAPLAAKKSAVAKKAAAPRKARRRTVRMRKAKFAVGQVVRHRVYAFRGVIFDIDPVFNNTEEWWLSIPEEIRPRKDQPFYHLLAENAETEYIAYVSEQNLLPDNTHEPLRHPQISELFTEDEDGRYLATFMHPH